MFYHRMYFKYIIIIFVFSQIFWIRRSQKTQIFWDGGVGGYGKLGTYMQVLDGRCCLTCPVDVRGKWVILDGSLICLQ
jgi:hypothetical protein